MTHDIPSEGRPSAVTGQPETPVASRVDERACSRPAAAAPGAAEGISAAPGISPADHPLGVETPEQAARYWQMRHAEAQIELAKGARRILELQAEVAAVSKRHVDAAADFTKELEGIRFHLDRIGVPTHRDGQVLTFSQRIWGLLEPATEHRLRVVAEAEVERLKASLAYEKRHRDEWEPQLRICLATLGECRQLIDKAAIPGLERDRMLSIQDRIRALIELAAKPVPVAPPPAEVERLKASLAEEQRERAKWESSFMASNATLAECHDLIDKAAIPGVERDLWESLQTRIRNLLERAANPVHVAPPPADTASCEQHLQERIEELETELKAAREHPAIDSIHAALDRAGVPRVEGAETPPRTRPKTPQSRIENLAAQRDLHRDVLDLVRANLRCGSLEGTPAAAKRRREDSDLLAWLDKVGDLVVLNLRVGPVCVKRGATGAHKTLRDALEAIRNSEIESVVRREAVK